MKYLSTFLALLILGGSALAQPLCNGDECGYESYRINSFPYTDSRNSCEYNDTGLGESPDVWYRFDMPYDGDILISLCDEGTDYDTYLWLLEDGCETVIYDNDDACGLVSELDIECLPEGRYYIAVEGYWYYCGNFTINVILGDECGPVTEVVPSEFALLPNYPNPFNPTTTIEFSLAEPAHAVLKVYSITGETVATLVDGELPSGMHSVQFNAARINSGVYFYHLSAGDYSATRKMTVLK